MQGRHWVLDPIDGTRGFVGMRQYAVCLGLLDAGQARPVMQRTLAPPVAPTQPGSNGLASINSILIAWLVCFKDLCSLGPCEHAD